MAAATADPVETVEGTKTELDAAKLVSSGINPKVPKVTVPAVVALTVAVTAVDRAVATPAPMAAPAAIVPAVVTVVAAIFPVNDAESRLLVINISAV